MKEFELKEKDFIPLCDLLKVTGLCQSGGEGKNLITNGLVLVDSKKELRKRCKIRANQVVEYNNQKIKVKK